MHDIAHQLLKAGELLLRRITVVAVTELQVGVRQFCRQKIWKNTSAKAMSKMLEK